MKTKKINAYRYVLLITFLVTFSCNYLDIVPDNIPTVEHSFKTRYEAENFLFGCFSFIPAYADAGANPALVGGDEVWIINPVHEFPTRLWDIARGLQGSNDPLANYWAGKQTSASLRGGKAMFTGLRDCNIFLENIHKPFDLQDTERERWIAEAKFLKAYYHFWLFRMYGPIPLVKENLPISASPEESQRHRDPVDDVVDYIVSLLDEAALVLPLTIEDIMNEMGRPTKPIALALKAQVLTLAASPLFNGNPDYANIKDNRGIELFPQAYSQEKWTKAVNALKIAIDAAHDAGHKLYDFRETTAVNTSGLNEKTIVSMHVRGAATERWNKEIVWGDPSTNPEMLQRACQPVFTTTQKQANSIIKCYSPPLEIVEQFYTNNGVPIEEDKNWVGKDLMELRTASSADKYYVKEGFKTIELHFDREPRFYGSISFDGGTFYGNGRTSTDDNLWITDFKNGTVGGGPIYANRYPSTAYLCKKLINVLTSVADNSSSLTSYRYAFPIIRLADLYLMYAEALNEAGGEIPSADVYTYIDSVRARSGLEGVVKSWHDYAINVNKPLTKTGMRDIIQRERLNELAFEGIRFWDLRRWKLAEEYMNKPVRGLNLSGETDDDFYQIVELYQLTFNKKDYLWPIKQSTLLNNRNLVQNYGW